VADASPILMAVYRGERDVLARLLAARPTLTFFEAAAVGDAARLREVLRTDPLAVKAHSGDGWTALHLAGFFGRADAVDALLAAGADVRARSTNSHANTPLHAAAANGGDVRIITALLAHGADANALEPAGYTPLHLVAERGDLALVELLLAHGADAGARTREGRTPLQTAESKGHAVVARRLRGEQP